MDKLTKATRQVEAIDKRIDAVRAELCRVAEIDRDAFDYETKEGQMIACTAFHSARRDYPGFDGIETALFRRRGDATDVRDDLIAKAARAEERRAAREYRKQFEAKRHACPTCGYEHYAA